MRLSLALFVVLGAALTTTLACQGNPTEEEARAIYQRQEKTVQTVAADLEAKAAALPYSDEAALRAIPAVRDGALALIRRKNVVGVKLDWVRKDGDRRLIDVGLTPGGHKAGRVPPAKGFTVDDRKVGWGAYQTSFAFPVNQSGKRAAATEGQPQEDVEYAKYGDGDYHPGIEVTWTFEIKGRTFRAYALILDDYDPPKSWYEGRIRLGE